MRAVKFAIITGALVVALAAPSAAQTPAGQTPAQPSPTAPAGQAQPPAATAPAPAKLQPPVPFPADAKIAFVDMNAIAQNSAAGKDASGKLKALNDKKVAEINDKNKQLQALQQKLNTGGSVLNDAARSQLEKDIDKLQRDIQFTQQNAQAEFQELSNDLQADFGKKVIPIIEAIAQEKGLHAVFTAESGTAYVHPGLDISAEVVKRLDAAPKK